MTVPVPEDDLRRWQEAAWRYYSAIGATNLNNFLHETREFLKVVPKPLVWPIKYSSVVWAEYFLGHQNERNFLGHFMRRHSDNDYVWVGKDGGCYKQEDLILISVAFDAGEEDLTRG